MKPAAFTFHRATSLDDALALLAAHPDAKPLAGGQSLIPAMNFRLARPAVLVDLNGVTALSGIAAQPADQGNQRAQGTTGLRIGAMTRHAAVERNDAVRRVAPLLAEAMPHVAHPQIRSRGTIGGSLAHADPSAELPAVMLALDAEFRLQRQGGDRWVAARDFFTGLFATALEPGELLTEVRIQPRAPRTGQAFLEVARRHGDYGLAGAATSVTLDGDGRVAAVRIALLSVADKPVLAASASTLVGQNPSDGMIRAIADAVREEIEPPADIHADARYRRQLASVLTQRTLSLAVQRAQRDAAIA